MEAPHDGVTPLISVWVNEALYFCTGPSECKAKNLDAVRRCEQVGARPVVGSRVGLSNARSPKD